jgi:uncharacterized membrane protein HdeD (DUF308 family)
LRAASSGAIVRGQDGVKMSDLTVPHRRGASAWFIVEGVLLIALGVVAAALPAAAGVAGALVFGWVLVLSDVFGAVALIGARPHTHLVWGAISAAIAIVVGALIVWRPAIGAVALALFVAAYLAADAVAMIGLALDQRRRAGRAWWWLVIAGVVDGVLAVIILAMAPVSDAVLLGFIIAVDLVVAGIALVTLGIAARRA